MEADQIAASMGIVEECCSEQELQSLVDQLRAELEAEDLHGGGEEPGEPEVDAETGVCSVPWPPSAFFALLHILTYTSLQGGRKGKPRRREHTPTRSPSKFQPTRSKL